jgi:transposase
VDAQGRALLRRRLRRSEVAGFFAGLPPCLVGMEACATAHHRGRELRRLGHEVRLMPPAYVRPYVKRGRTDAADAEAICEAVARPTMRFVPVKAAEQHAALVLHRARDLLVRQRTVLINALRGHMAEFGIIAPRKGPAASANSWRRWWPTRRPDRCRRSRAGPCWSSPRNCRRSVSGSRPPRRPSTSASIP